MPAAPLAAPVLAAALCMALSPHASAQTVGFLQTQGGGIDAAINYNSAGGTNAVTTTGTGTYLVTFPALGDGVNSDVQVNAIHTANHRHYCTSVNWNPGQNGVIANVACFDGTGKPSGADFSILYQSRTTAPSSGSIAFLWADQPTTANYTPYSLYNFNSLGGTNTVRRNAVGSYTAFLPGFIEHGNPQVTAYGNTAAHCQVQRWFRDANNTKIDVLCVDAEGNPADELFDLSYTVNTTEAAGPVATTYGAYAYANNPTKRLYFVSIPRQFNNLGGFKVGAYHRGPQDGHYELEVLHNNAYQLKSVLGMITAVGAAGEYCEQAGIISNGSELDMQSFCYNSAGDRTDTTYSAMFVTSR